MSELNSIATLCEYLELQAKFYDDGLKLVNQAMSDVYDFRSFVEHKRKAFKANTANRYSVRESVVIHLNKTKQNPQYVSTQVVL